MSKEERVEDMFEPESVLLEYLHSRSIEYGSKGLFTYTQVCDAFLTAYRMAYTQGLKDGISGGTNL